MKIYNFNENGEYVSTEKADKDPLEKGKFLIPANSTIIPVLDKVPGKKRVFSNNAWSYVDIAEEFIPLTIEQIKTNRIAEFNGICNSKICEGFYSTATGVEHFYRFNLEIDQHNFEQQTLMLLRHSEIDTIEWKTEDADVVIHTRQQYFEVVDDAASNKKSLVERYRVLKEQIINAQTIEDVENINW